MYFYGGLYSLYFDSTIDGATYDLRLKALVIALLVKMLWQPMMIYFFEGAGPLWATSLGFILATVYMGYHLYYQTLFNLKKVAIQLAKVVGISFVMMIVSSLTLLGLKQIH